MRVQLSRIAALAVAVTAVTTSCTPTYTGQVFVVTEGRENIKMGLVGIHVVSPETLLTLAPATAKQLDEIETTTATAIGRNIADEEALAKFQAVLDQIDVSSVNNPVVEKLRDQIASRQSPLGAERKALIADRESRVAGVIDSFFRALPGACTKTDADGRFTIKAEPGAYIFARAERTLRANGGAETYFWGARAKRGEREILLSNDSLLSGSSAVRIFLSGIPGVIENGQRSGPPAFPSAELVAWIEKATALAKESIATAMASASLAQERERDARRRRLAEAYAAAERANAELLQKRVAQRVQTERDKRAEEQRRIDASRNAAQKRVEWLLPSLQRAGITEGAARTALTVGGTVTIWGNCEHNEDRIPAGLSSVVAIAAGPDHVLAVKADGTVAAWGAHEAGQTDVPSDLYGVVSVAAGTYQNLALRHDGTVVTWGTPPHRSHRVPPSLRDVVAVTACGQQFGALRANGSVVVWGDGPNVIDFTDCAPLSAFQLGKFVAAGITRDGKLSLWSFMPAGRPTIHDVRAIAAAESGILAITREGTPYRWDIYSSQTAVPSNLPPQVFAIAAAGRHFAAAGLTDSGQCHLALWGDPSITPVSTPRELVQLALGERFAVALVVTSDLSTNR